MITLYGIKNCDTIRRARKWLDEAGIDHRYHDFRQDGVTAAEIGGWAAAVGVDTLLNRRGTTWRKLPEETRDGRDEAGLIALMEAQPALIKRPVWDLDGAIRVGFSKADQAELATQFGIEE